MFVLYSETKLSICNSKSVKIVMYFEDFYSSTCIIRSYEKSSEVCNV